MFYLGYIQKGTTSTLPKSLKSKDFPSITGNPAIGPIFPNPRIDVPSVTIVHSFLVLELTFSYCTSFRSILSLK